MDHSAIRVIGRTAAVAADGSTPRLSPGNRQLLAAFVAAGPAGASADVLAEALWASELPARWSPSFRMAVSRLRETLHADVVAEDGTYRLDLPVEAVDAWWLLDLAADDDRPISQADLARALAGPAFREIDGGVLVDDAITRCTSAQAIIACRFCDSVDSIDDRSLTLLVEFQQSLAPFDEHVIHSIAKCLIRSRRTATAAIYLNDVLEFHQAELGTRPPDLLTLRKSLEQGTSPPQAAATTGPPVAEGQPTRAQPAGPTTGDLEPPGGPSRPRARDPRVPPLLEHVVDEPCFGRETERARLTSGRSHLILGPLGSGKTRLLAAVAESAVAAGDHVSFVGADASRTPYGPFLAAFPRLRSELFVGLDRVDAVLDGGDSAAVRTADTRRTLLVVDELDAVADGGRHWLLIDDIHAFDEASRRLVGFLAMAETQSPLTIVVAARNDDGQEWITQLDSGLRRAGFGTIALGPLGPTELEAMLAEALPDLTITPRAELARDLFARSGGLPAVARTLLQTIDRETLTFDDRVENYEPDRWTQPTADLDPRVFQVGVAAAVLGDIFAITDVMALVEQPEEQIGAALEELWRREIMIDGKDPSELRFANTLLRNAFLGKTPSFRLAELHTRAARLTDDPHARADHEAAAVPAVPAQQAADSLLRSASISMEEGAWRDAVDALRRALALAVDEPEPATLIMMATALELSGANGAGPRRVAFQRAVAERRWQLALEAALAGLPEAERPDGDPDRIEMLQAIPVDELDDEQRFERSLALARQCALNGWPDQARHWAEEGSRLATDDRRRVRADIAAWSVAHHVSPEPHHLGGLDRENRELAVGSSADNERMRIAQLRAITVLETGDMATASSLHHQFMDLAVDVGDPARIWQGKVLAATLAFDAGRWDEAATRSEEAAEYGTRHAMQQADLVHLGQTFYRRLLEGDEGQMVAYFERMPANTEASAIAVAAHALALAGQGRSDEAWRNAAPTVLDALDRPRGSALVVLAMLAGLIRYAADPEVVERVRERLTPFADRSLVVGYGIATAGPVHRHLGLLAADPDEAAAHFETAVPVADRSGALTWQVATRLELAQATDRADPVAEALELAAGTEVEVLIPIAARR